MKPGFTCFFPKLVVKYTYYLQAPMGKILFLKKTTTTMNVESDVKFFTSDPSI